MKSKFIKAQISLLLAATFTVTGVVSNLSSVVQAATIEQQYLEDFEDGIEGIDKVYGGGIISHVDGGLEIQAANWPDQGQYTLAVDNNSPVIKDGVLELDMKVKSHAGRLGLVFRYVDTNNYSMVGYDVSGKWVLKTVTNGKESETVLVQNGINLNNGQTYKMKLVFAGTLLELYVDGSLLYSGNTLVDSEGGKFGFRQWGYTDNYSHANYDNIRYYSQKAPEQTEDGHYLVSFDDDDTRGWEVKSGDGAISAANGKLTAQADGNNSNTISSDKNAPVIKDGFVETKITVNNHAGRVGVLFRYEDANNFAGIGYDVDGTWVWLNGSNNGKLPFTKVLEQGREYKLSVKYAGEYITVLIDEEKVYEGIVSGIKTTAGKIGLRNWGYPGNYSNATFDYFVNGEFSPVTNAKANSHLRVEGENDATITQTATGLVPGQSYSASVWVEVSDGRKVTLSVENANGEEVSNYTDRTNVVFGVHHTDKYKTNYQRVRVNFTVPEGESTAKVSLKVAGGAGNSWANLDGVRIMKLNGITDQGEHYFYDDFENVDFGFGPFVSTESDNSHLSQTNEPYTDDTIGGEYSLKIRYGDYMRTLPATVRFKPNTTYRVGFDYMAYRNQAFTASIKSDKAREANDASNATIKTVDISNSSKQAVLEFTTGNYDDYYLEIRKNNDSTLIVDNLCVDEIVNVSKEDLQSLVNELKALNENDYTAESFAVLKAKITLAEDVIAKADATEDELRNAYNGLKSAKEALVRYATTEELNTFKAKVAEMKEVNADDYKQDSNWTEFQNAIEKAEALLKKDKVTSNEVTNSINENEANNVMADKNAMEEEVKTTYDKLVRAFLELRLKPNKDKLQDLINKSENLDSSKYTKESWANLQDKLTLAKAIMANEDANLEDVEAAEKTLELALYELSEAKPEDNNQGNNGNNGNRNNGGNNNSGDGNGKLPQTGGTSSGVVALLGLAIGAVRCVFSKKKNK